MGSIYLFELQDVIFTNGMMYITSGIRRLAFTLKDRGAEKKEQGGWESHASPNKKSPLVTISLIHLLFGLFFNFQSLNPVLCKIQMKKYIAQTCTNIIRIVHVFCSEVRNSVMGNLRNFMSNV